MMELVFLGTGAGLPTKERNVSCCVLNLMVERKALWVFDCGEGTQHQFLKTKLNISKIEKIFISHLHGDHLYGLPGLLGSRSFRDNFRELTIYGPKGIKQYLETVFKISDTYISYPLTIVEIAEAGIIFEDDQFTVMAAPLKHRIESYGFRVIEQDKVGQLDFERLQANNVPRGPHYKKLKKGAIVTLEDGRVINGKDFIKSAIKGKIVTIFGDTVATGNSILLAKGADVMVHEATLEDSLTEIAERYGHTTTVQVAKIAKKAQVKKLIITHISSRYSLKDNERLVDECRSVFANTEMATDFAVFKV